MKKLQEMGDRFAQTAQSFIQMLSQALGAEISFSPVAIQIKDRTGIKDSYYGYTGTQAIRVELNSDGDIVGVSVWVKPGDLDKPGFRIDLSATDPQDQLDMIAEVMKGAGENYVAQVQEEQYILHTIPFHESIKDDVGEFLSSLGNEAYGKKMAHLYRSYLAWADINDKKKISSMAFNTHAKAWLSSNGEGSAQVTRGGSSPSQQVTTPSEEDLFAQSVFADEAKHNMDIYNYELTRMSKAIKGEIQGAQLEDVPKGLFVYGNPGLGKTFTVKKVFKREGIWGSSNGTDSPAVYKSGGIAGFTGLLQILWDYRKGYCVILDDNDAILKVQTAANMLKGALQSDKEDRRISYTKMRRH